MTVINPSGVVRGDIGRGKPIRTFNTCGRRVQPLEGEYCHDSVTSHDAALLHLVAYLSRSLFISGLM